MSQMDSRSKFVPVVTGLFAVPFCLIGVLALSGRLHLMSGGVPAPFVAVFVFGLLFAGAGSTLLGGIAWWTRKARQQNTVRAENPSSPWMWRSDWAEGRCNSRTKSTMIFAWVLALFWNAVSFPSVFSTPQQTFREKPLTLLALVFPLAGVGLLIGAVRKTLAWFEFGKTYFQMTAVPIVIGRDLRGAIQARFPKPPEHGIRLKLSCVNRIVTGSGKEQTARENIVWRDEHTVSPAELYANPTGTTIPVSFHVPLDARQTDSSNPRNSIFWLLEADADAPGVDYKDIFELPVFRTKDTPTEAEEAETATVEASIKPPTNPTIQVTPVADGTEFYFPAARNKGFAAGMSVFFAAWNGVLWLIFHLHVPIIFPVVFGLFDLLFFYLVLDMWFGVSTVIVNSSGLRVRSGLFGGGKWQDVSLSEIAGIDIAIRSQQGGRNGTPYYNIELIQANGRKITLGETIRDKQEAEWLASEMRTHLGLKPRFASASAGAS